MLKKLATLLGIMAVGALGGMLVTSVVQASRNSSGTYSLPAGNPVVSGTNISTSWANGTLGDLSTEMSDSLSRSGKGGMNAPLRVPDGSASAPALSYSNETGTGLYRNGAGDLRLGVTGTPVWKWNSTGGGPLTSGFSAFLNAPAGLAADYTLTLPALPGSTLAVMMTSAGVMTAGGQLPRSQLPTVGQQIGSGTGCSTTSASYVACATLTVTLTTTGRPVIVGVIPVASSSTLSSFFVGETSGLGVMSVQLLKDGTAIQGFQAQCTAGAANGCRFPTSFLTMDVPSAASHTYSIQILSVNGDSVSITGVMVAYEL